MIGLIEFAFNAQLIGVFLYIGKQILICAAAIDLRLAYTEKVDVGAVQNKKTHVQIFLSANLVSTA